MPARGSHGDDATDAIHSALAVEDGLHQLCRTTLTRPDLTPAEVDAVLASLASAVAALPQAVQQLADVLDHARQRDGVESDGRPAESGRHAAIDVAQRHLRDVRGPALQAYQLLDAAHQETARIAAPDHDADGSGGASVGQALERHPEERQPPSMRSPERGPGPPR